MANIVAKIQNIEPLLTVLIEHHILTFLSSGYRLVTNAATDQQVAKLIEVSYVCGGGGRGGGELAVGLLDFHMYAHACEVTMVNARITNTDHKLWKKNPRSMCYEKMCSCVVDTSWTLIVFLDAFSMLLGGGGYACVHVRCLVD